MKSLTVRLPDSLVTEIESEAKARRQSKSFVVRRRLIAGRSADASDPLAAIRDLIGCAEGLPQDLSSRVDEYLRETGYGRPKRPR